MATIRECDRCGRQTQYVGGDKPHRWTGLRVCDTIGARNVELCEGCGNALREFLAPLPRAARRAEPRAVEAKEGE